MNMLVLLLVMCMGVSLNSAATNNNSTSGTYHQFMWGYYNDMKGNHGVAHNCYTQLLPLQLPMVVNKAYLEHLYRTKKYDTLITLIPKYEKIFEHDSDVQFLCAQTYEKLGKQAQADTRYMTLGKHENCSAEMVYYAAIAFMRAGKLQEALTVMDAFLAENHAYHAQYIFYFLKSHIYQQLGDTPRALVAIKKSMALQPQFDQGWLMWGLLHRQHGELNEAQHGYQQFLNLVSDRTTPEYGLLENVIKKERYALTRYEDARAAYTTGNYDKALVLVDQFLHDNPTTYDAIVLKIEILGAQKKPREILELLEQHILANSSDERWLALVHIFYHGTQDKKAVVDLMKKIQKKEPKNLLIALYAADLVLRSKNYKESVEYGQKALALSHEPQLSAKILYQLAIAAYEHKDAKKLDEIAQKTATLAYEYVPLLNLLAYHYAEHNNYVKAQQYCDKVLAHDPKNPHYRDTQAYIFLQQKMFDKARVILDEISKELPEDRFVQEHAAQVKI